MAAGERRRRPAGTARPGCGTSRDMSWDVMLCHDPHVQGACSVVSSDIRQRSTPRPRDSCVCLHPAHRALIPFRSLSFRSSFRRPTCDGPCFARAHAHLSAPARAGQAQGAGLPSAPRGFCVGGDAEGGAASGCRFLLYHSSMEFSGSSSSRNYYRIFFERCPGSGPAVVPDGASASIRDLVSQRFVVAAIVATAGADGRPAGPDSS